MRKLTNVVLSLALLGTVLIMHHFVVVHGMKSLPETALVDVVAPISITAFFELDKSMAATPMLMEHTEIEGYPVAAYYTTREAADFFGLSMKYGLFDPWQDGTIVISDRLAVSIFLTDNVLGAPLRLDGRQYIVCGVYWADQTLLAQISRTNETDVYLPLASYSDQEAQIDKLLIDPRGATNTIDRISEIGAILDTELVHRSVFNFSETRLLAAQSIKLHWLVFALFTCGLIGLTFARQSIGMLSAQGSWRGHFENKREMVQCALLLIFFVACLFFVKWTSFPLFLPQDLVTYKGSLAGYALENLQLGNFRTDIFLCTLSQKVKLCLFMLDVCFAVFAALSAYRMERALASLLSLRRKRS